MKKIFLLFLIISLSFLGGCKQYEEKQEDKTILKFSSWGSRTEYSILKEIISEYEKNHPNIKIEFIHVPENYFRKLHLLYAAKTPPDVVFINNTFAPLYIKANLLEDLSEYFDEKIYFKSSIDCFKYDNKLYAIPRDISNLVLYINKDIIKNPQNIKTLDDLKNYSKKYTTKNRFGLNYEENPLFWLYYLEYFNGGILSDNGKTIIITQPESIKGIEFYTNMINIDNSIPHKWQMSAMTSAQMFISGKTAMLLSGRWMVPKYRETIKFDWDIIPFPTTKKSKTLTDASGWAVSKASKNKEEAINFIHYLTSKEISEKFTQTGLITPARIDVANSQIFLNTDEKPYNSKVFIDVLQKSKPTPVNENYAKIIDDITKNIEPVLNGKKQTKNTFTSKYSNKLQKLCY